jgi:hypothetical protein
LTIQHRARRLQALVGYVFLAVASLVAHAEPRVQVLSVDLPSLIEKASHSPSQFAVDVPYTASPSTAGEWTTSGSRSIWRHSAQIPGAVSMSFHASRAALPASATLIVTSNGVRYVYTSADVHDGEMWSRIARGDVLSFEIDVATADASRVQLDITSLQAGYRGLGADAPNHPRYNQLHIQAATARESCSENWDCRKTPANSSAGQATVALVIGNVGQCSGTLLNDVPGDATPYVLTARHCQNGNPDGGSPGSAAVITVYWNAVSVCGTTLGQIYDPGITTQYGATTIVDQQDAWLIRLNELPAVDDAYYAGWDATGAAFVGGFTPHHALGSKRQFVGWYGQASYNVVPPSRWSVGFESTIWATINSIGNGGPGSSGSGLFDDNARLVGVVVRGKNQGDSEDSPGLCPGPSPESPTLQNATTFSTALSGIFSSLSDAKSSTGTLTIQSVLDPANTGTKVINGQRRPLQVTLDNYHVTTQVTGNQVQLNWRSDRATSCTASGGEAGDGWSGSIPISGNKTVSNVDGGDITYTVTCTDGDRTGTAQTKIHWELAAPFAFISYGNNTEYGVPFRLTWSSNLRDCVASGGKPGDGWSGPVASRGEQQITELVPGQVTFTISCGTGTRTAVNNTTPYITPPTVTTRADATNLRIGQSVTVGSASIGAPCVRTGGSPGDGWAGSDVKSASSVILTETVPGTYTYVTQCGSGVYVASSQASVTFTNDAPFAKLTSSRTTAPVGETYTELKWTSNVRPCSLVVEGPGVSGFVTTQGGPTGSTTDMRYVIGRYTYGVACGSGSNTTQASVTVDWTGEPNIMLSAQSAGVAGEGFYLNYRTNLLPCAASGGGSGDSWAGRKIQQYEGLYIAEATAGDYTFVLECDNGSQAVKARATVKVIADAPTATLTATPSLQLIGSPVTLSWTSNTESCAATGGPSSGWTGTLASSGSITVTENTAVSRSYQIRCGTEPLTAYASTYVTWAVSIPSPAVSLTASPSSATVGADITLTWTAENVSSCTAAGSQATSGWLGSVTPAGGSKTFRESAGGTYNYTISCLGTAGMHANASAVVTLNTPPVAASNSGGGGGGGGGTGGGGAMSLLDVGGLGAVLLLVLRVRRREARPAV